MKKNIIIIFLIFFFISNCGYKPLNSSKNLNVSISKINFSGEEKINKIIKNNLKTYLNLENRSKKINLNISSQKDIITISKDSKGDPLNLKMEINIEMDHNSINKRIRKKIKDYYKKSENNFISKTRIEYLIKTIQFLKNYGEVYLVRLPIHNKIMEIEKNKFPNFKKHIEYAIKISDNYFDLTNLNDSLLFTDGNHLHKSSALIVSKKIANEILKSKNKTVK